MWMQDSPPSGQIKSPALRYHGAKFRLAPWILSFFPEHSCYVEPFGGAAGVLLQKPRVYAEIYNDLDEDIVNFFRVVRDRESCEHLVQQLELTPFARGEFEIAFESCDCPIERARRTVIRSQMGFGSGGATKASTGFRIDMKRSYGTASHLWTRFPETLARVCERFAGVLIENRPAIEVMNQHDSESTLHFVDPPYLHSTRQTKSTYGVYRHEMTDMDHFELLENLKQLSGFVVLSGYPSKLYDRELKDWERHSTKSRISSFRGSSVKTEVVWLNKAASDALHGKFGGLFA